MICADLADGLNLVREDGPLKTDLIDFALSEAYADLRQILGISVAL